MKKMSRFITFVAFTLSGSAYFYISILCEETKFLFITAYTFICISIFITENFFTKPSDVLVSCISIIITIIPLLIREVFNSPIHNIAKAYIYFLIVLAVLSFLTFIFSDKNKSESNTSNKIFSLIKDLVCTIGNSRSLYLVFFIILFIHYYNKENIYFIIPVIYILSIFNSKYDFVNKMKSFQKIKNSKDDIGSIVATESSNIIIAKLHSDKETSVKLFNEVHLKSIEDNKTIKYGIIINIIHLPNEKKIKILLLDDNLVEEKNKVKNEDGIKKHIVYKSNNESKIKDSFVGIVAEGSSIDTLYFKYSEENKIKEGTLVKVKVDDTEVYYQVINGYVKNKELKEENSQGYILAEAIQLGKYESDKNQFSKYGWVPRINTPIFKVTKENFKTEYNPTEYDIKIGAVPNTNIPIYFNIKESLNYHTAILGVTGAGKTTLVNKFLIPNIMKKNNTHVIIFDLTSQYEKEFQNTYNINSNIIEACTDVYKKIDNLMKEEAEFKNKRDEDKIEVLNNDINNSVKIVIENFINQNEKKIAILSISDLSNIESTISFFMFVFKNIFQQMKEHYNKLNNKLCLVLEEAHTLIPERNYIGGMSDTKITQGMLNTISQIALQGRKYNIGLFVISQRTAIVSKTILSQCNTIISFRSYDKTSEDFLAGYINIDMAKKLGGLEKYHTIVFGKASNNNIPLICQIDEIEKPKEEMVKEEVKKNDVKIEKNNFDDDEDVPF